MQFLGQFFQLVKLSVLVVFFKKLGRPIKFRMASGSTHNYTRSQKLYCVGLVMHNQLKVALNVCLFIFLKILCLSAQVTLPRLKRVKDLIQSPVPFPALSMLHVLHQVSQFSRLSCKVPKNGIETWSADPTSTLNLQTLIWTMSKLHAYIICWLENSSHSKPAHHEGWMVSGQETVFCSVPVP